VLKQYYVYWALYGIVENATNRDILPASSSNVFAYNPAPEVLDLAWNFSAPYSNPSGLFQFAVLEQGENTTFGYVYPNLLQWDKPNIFNFFLGFSLN